MPEGLMPGQAEWFNYPFYSEYFTRQFSAWKKAGIGSLPDVYIAQQQQANQLIRCPSASVLKRTPLISSILLNDPDRSYDSKTKSGYLFPLRPELDSKRIANVTFPVKPGLLDTYPNFLSSVTLYDSNYPDGTAYSYKTSPEKDLTINKVAVPPFVSMVMKLLEKQLAGHI